MKDAHPYELKNFFSNIQNSAIQTGFKKGMPIF